MPVYSDINNVWKDGDNPLVEDILSVYQSIDSILRTGKGERVFLPDFGGNLDDFVFEPIDETTELMIFRSIILDIERWDNRVILNHQMTKVESDPDNNKYALTLVFNIIGLGNQLFEFVGELII